jgi:hypothetical protein
LSYNQKAAATGNGPAAAYVCVRGAYNPKKVTRSKPDSLRSARHGDVTDYIRAAMKQAPDFGRSPFHKLPVLVCEVTAG